MHFDARQFVRCEDCDRIYVARRHAGEWHVIGIGDACVECGSTDFDDMDTADGD